MKSGLSFHVLTKNASAVYLSTSDPPSFVAKSVANEIIFVRQPESIRTF
jgi:hypothetical protein